MNCAPVVLAYGDVDGDEVEADVEDENVKADAEGVDVEACIGARHLKSPSCCWRPSFKPVA